MDNNYFVNTKPKKFDFTITADSVPDLDEWGWDDYWKINDWITWHKAMKKKYGKDYANTKFLQWWGKQTTGANPLDARSFNSDFRKYAKDNGFLNALYADAPIIQPIGAGTDIISGASDVVSNVGETVVSASKVVKILVPVLLVAGFFLLIMYAYKQTTA